MTDFALVAEKSAGLADVVARKQLADTLETSFKTGKLGDLELDEQKTKFNGMIYHHTSLLQRPVSDINIRNKKSYFVGHSYKRLFLLFPIVWHS